MKNCDPVTTEISRGRLPDRDLLQVRTTSESSSRYINNCYRRCKKEVLVTGHLKQEELQKCSIWPVQYQASTYPDEVAVLQHGNGNSKKDIERTSPVHKLSPFLEEHGVLRVDSRICAIPCVTYDFKFPIIRPRHYHLTKLNINWYNHRYLHANHAAVQNEVRQRLHISSLRTVRQITKVSTRDG